MVRRAAQVEVALNVKQVSVHGQGDLPGTRDHVSVLVNSLVLKLVKCLGPGAALVAESGHRYCKASQNSDSEGTASSDSACSIRLLIGA
jgi:hypothetical protein